MRLSKLLFAAPLAVIPFLASPDVADACGGCFVQQSESTQVTGHKMVLGISTEQTTLYDQITYSGAPEEFAWVLPIKGQVDVALSSDALFQSLESLTRVEVYSPQINCQPQFCDDGGFSNGAGGASSEGGGGPGVQIIAQEVVGPYETVQLTSDDPAALTDWLTSHGYNIPADIQPVIDAYVGEDFDFLALRLVPGEGIDSMRPVAITSPGAVPALPLRMVAAGTGATTAITLWVVGEGKYEPQNFPSFTIREQDLVWDWDAQRSNYGDLKATQFERSGGHAWLFEAAEPLNPWAFDELLYFAETNPVESGYADDDGLNAVVNATADIERLTAGTDRATRWITRLSAELSRDALTTDLALQASADQSSVNRWFYIENAIGTPPECPPPPDCGDDGLWEDGGQGGEATVGGGRASGCAVVSPGADAGAGLAALAVAGLVLARRRRRLS